MREVLLKEAVKLHKEHKRKRIWQKVASVMAAVVVFCTTYALILPAITMDQDAVCGQEAHTHGEDCYEQQRLYDLNCILESTEGVMVLHTHSDVCYDAEGMLRCSLPELVEHVHTDECASGEEPCEVTELQPHIHEETCYDSQGNLQCQLPVVIVHDHADCLVETDQYKEVLICQIPEHIHTDACYPAEPEEGDAVLGYLCGSGEHIHNENCLNEAGECICTIPEHIHEAACLVENLDLTADIETEQQWETALLANVELTGNWSRDILAVAETQLGYRESARNCVLVEGELKGYTRYGQWYGEIYGDWAAMFVAFCLEYAEIFDEYMPYDSDAAHWVEQLMDRGIFTDADEYAPKIGDLIFLDTDAENGADFVGIVAELPDEPDEKEIRIIAGNTADNNVDYLTVALDAESVVGYGILPENPLSEEQWAQAKNVAALLAELPEAQVVVSTLETLQNAGDKAGYEALRQEIFTRIDRIRTDYKALDDHQRKLVSGMERLDELEAVCGACWQDLPTLTDDSALLTELTVTGVDVLRDSVDGVESEYSIKNHDVLHFHIQGGAESCYSDLRFGEARVRLELVLPVSEDKARFDLDAMDWLEEAVLTAEIRNEVTCQVLTGYKRMTGTDDRTIAVPGSFAETVVVEIFGMTHGESVNLTVSAAMEYSAWDGQCQTHQRPEKLTIQSQTYNLDDPLPEEQRSTTYVDFLVRIEELIAGDETADEKKAAANALLDQIVDAYYEGLLTTAELEELGDELRSPLGYISEYATGFCWMLGMRNYTSGAETYTVSTQVAAPKVRALSAELYSEVFNSTEQIDKEGGGNSSTDGAVYVSKTIEGTDAENVFDITLMVITQDQVNEVYKEPDMAVVVVMDISNTMNSKFTGTTISRYEAAMDAGEEFLKNFAANTSGLSKVGYVAFNTHAHEIFDLSSCGTEAEAAALAAEMRNDTKPIIEATDYASSWERFTNIEAGLKMANDMLADATNQHKYIIFISDGYPTTYIDSGYTGYDPYTGSGSNGTDGVFYDAVLDVHCDSGTSYSDTAAIKARELAVNLKNQGVNIFSIGVDVGGQNLWTYHNSGVGWGTFSVFERREEASYYYDHGYEIGTKHGEFAKDKVVTGDGKGALAESEVDKTAMAQDFKDWLRGTATTGIGSGYYYDSTNTEGLKTAYEQIFAKIKEMNAASSHLDWVAADPMGDMGVHDVDAVEFIGFFDRTGALVEDRGALVGESAEGAENTADFHAEDTTIHWNLKESGYTSVAIDNTNQYMCRLKYRIRLKNEDSAFDEGVIYDTNDRTTLTYRVIDVKDGVTSISERRTIDFPIPAVHGYLSELNFKKVSTNGTSLPGAEFTLRHDAEACALCTDPGMTCSGHGVSAVEIGDMVATSDAAGIVTFTDIPSGHIYTLTETKVPDGYINTNNTYQVMISYDAQTITVLDAKGNPLEWTGSIENDLYYELPNTGGMGTSPLIYGGALMICASMLYILCITGHKRRKEGR